MVFHLAVIPPVQTQPEVVLTLKPLAISTLALSLLPEMLKKMFVRQGGVILRGKKWTYYKFFPIGTGPQFQNFTLKCCF